MTYTITERHSVARQHIYYAETRQGEILVFSHMADFFYCSGDRLVKLSAASVIFNGKILTQIRIHYEGMNIEVAKCNYRNAGIAALTAGGLTRNGNLLNVQPSSREKIPDSGVIVWGTATSGL